MMNLSVRLSIELLFWDIFICSQNSVHRYEGKDTEVVEFEGIRMFSISHRKICLLIKAYKSRRIAIRLKCLDVLLFNS